MKNSLIHQLFWIFFFALLSAATNAQDNSVKVKEQQVASTIMSKEVTLMVRLPDSYNASKMQYTVLYYLHSNSTMVEEVATISQELHQDKSTPELIVVGIDIEDESLVRMSDVTIYDKFLSYMEQELMPAIGKQYRTDGHSILYEKSFSGSLALYALLTKPAMFNGYIAVSKQWYDTKNDYFRELAKKALKNPASFEGRKIFLATLNGAYNNNNIPEVDKQMSAFAKQLETKSDGKITAGYQAFDDWGITPQPGFSDGLVFVNAPEKAVIKKVDRLTMAQTPKGNWVIMDSKKKTLYEVFNYDNGPDYPSEGLIRVVKNGKIGYADATTYAIVIEPQFDCAFPFENGKAQVSNQCQTVMDGENSIWTSEVWQYVNKRGKF